MKTRLQQPSSNAQQRAGSTSEPTLSPAQQAAVDAIIAKAVAEGIAQGLARAAPAAPAVHTEDRRNSKPYLDDQAREELGDERADQRAESEGRFYEHQRNFARPQYGSTSARERGDAGLDQRSKDAGVGLLVAEYMGWLTRGKGDAERAERMAKKFGGSKACIRALGESIFGSGGAFVPVDIANDFIELLYNSSVYLKANPLRMTVPHGNMTLPRLNAGGTANWVGESQNIPPSQQQTGQVRIDLRMIAAITAASNMFLRDSGPSAVQFIREDLSMQLAVAIDAAALRSLGTEHRITGLRGWVPTANTFASSGTTIPNITTDLMRLMRILEEAKIPMARLAFFASPRTKWGLMGARDGNNNLVWAPELSQGRLYGAQFFTTQNIPNNVGTGGNKSEIYLVDMSQQIFAEDPAGLRIDVVDGPAYFDGSAVVSGFSRDESAVRVIQRVDTVSRQNGNDIAEIYDVAIA